VEEIEEEKGGKKEEDSGKNKNRNLEERGEIEGKTEKWKNRVGVEVGEGGRRERNKETKEKEKIVRGSRKRHRGKVR